jgi:3-oxoacyl-[acyl-carrier protein] reductase
VTERLLDLEGRTYVVAGAGGGGIGTATCAAIVLAGGRVIAIDNNINRLEMVARLSRVTPRLADARDLVALERVLSTEGPVNGLVHVAGGLRVDQWERTEDLRLSSFDDVIANNLRSALVTSRVVATQMLANGTPGSIVHVSSIAALGALPFGAAYAVAKAGMLALMRTEAVEWGPSGIRVNAIAPGSIASADDAGYSPDGTADHAIPLRRRAEPDDIASAALYLLSDLSSFVTGHTLVVDGGASVRPAYLDDTDLPVFVKDAELRPRLVR